MNGVLRLKTYFSTSAEIVVPKSTVLVVSLVVVGVVEGTVGVLVAQGGVHPYGWDQPPQFIDAGVGVEHWWGPGFILASMLSICYKRTIKTVS